MLDFEQEFPVMLKNIGHMLAMMFPWNGPLYLKRIWCVFELHTASINGCQVSIVMPPNEKVALQQERNRASEPSADLGVLSQMPVGVVKAESRRAKALVAVAVDAKRAGIVKEIEEATRQRVVRGHQNAQPAHRRRHSLLPGRRDIRPTRRPRSHPVETVRRVAVLPSRAFSPSDRGLRDRGGRLPGRGELRAARARRRWTRRSSRPLPSSPGR